MSGTANSASWSGPGRGPGSSAALLDDPPHDADRPTGEPVDTGADVRAGIATALGLVLLGAPAGLLWALVAPKVRVVLSDSSVMLVDPDRSAFIASDGFFLAVVLGVGLATGVLSWVLGGRRHGPAVVLALTIGGLLAAFVAARTGGLLHESDARDAVEAGLSGEVDLAVRLRATEAMVGWPVGALLGFLVPTLLSRDGR